MKKCLQCEQVYGDDTNFCLSDGSTLVGFSGSYDSPGEAPTVYSGQPFPTSPSGSPSSFNNAPFVAPGSGPTAPEPARSHTLLIALAVGIVALVIGGAVVGLVMYGLLKDNGNDNKNVANVSNSNDRANKTASPEQKSDDDNRAQKLKEQQEKLDKDKQKLEDERKALEAKKKEAAPTPRPSSATTATITDPPSNVRSSPNGAIICVLRTRGTTVNILGPTGVTDNNGAWYYTDVCGRQGVIHSTQIRF